MIATVTYEGSLQTTCRHLQSGYSITTDAPTDNRGNGSAFSPTDLTATSLAACMLTTMGIYAMDAGLSLQGARAEVTKIMASDPRRIAEIQIAIFLPEGNSWPDKIKKKLEHIAHHCPVALSLHPAIRQKVELTFG